MSGKKITKTIDHPMEEFLDIESGTTEVEVYQREGEIIKSEDYDEKDSEIDEQYQEIYDSAMEGYDLLSEEIDKVEGKYKARIGEVSVQHLNVALNAASHKAKMKQHKDKLESKDKTPSTVTNHNTLVVSDRDALMDQLRKGILDDKRAKDEDV